MNMRGEIKDMMGGDIKNLLMDVKKTLQNIHEDADGSGLNDSEVEAAKNCVKILTGLVHVCDGAEPESRRSRLSEIREDRDRATSRG